MIIAKDHHASEMIEDIDKKEKQLWNSAKKKTTTKEENKKKKE